MQKVFHILRKASQCKPRFAKMEQANIKNDIKMLHFIVNSLSGLLLGFYLFSVGITAGIALPHYGLMMGVQYAAGGVALLAFTALGYYAAIVGKKIWLVIYFLLSGVAAGLNVTVYVLSTPHDFRLANIWLSSVLMAHAGLLLMGMALSITLAVQADKNNNYAVNITSETPKEKSELDAKVLELNL